MEDIKRKIEENKNEIQRREEMKYQSPPGVPRPPRRSSHRTREVWVRGERGNHELESVDDWMVELAVRRARSWEGTFGNAGLYGRERDQLYVLNEDDRWCNVN